MNRNEIYTNRTLESNIQCFFFFFVIVILTSLVTNSLRVDYIRFLAFMLFSIYPPTTTPFKNKNL